MSGIYIPDIEMPENCRDCSMCVQVSDGDIDFHYECCLLYQECACENNDRRYPSRKRKLDNCPLVPVPDHGRLMRVLKTERECVSRECDRDCGKCNLLLDRDEILTAYDELILLFEAPTVIPADSDRKEQDE